MLGLLGGVRLPNGHPQMGAFDAVRLPGDGTFDRVASLAQFLMGADAAIVDLDELSSGLVQNAAAARGVSIASGDVQKGNPIGSIGIADPVTALGLGFVAQASVPIRLHGERVGTLAVVSRTAREFGARDVETLRRLADLVSEGLALREGVVARPF
jgi:GAF domain-containing protein